ncbi:MAG: M20/M25/M40 family metallo-hydrolase [bacterium]
MTDNLAQQIKELTLELVKIPSITETRGEIALVEHLHGYLAKTPYFQSNPDHLRLVDIDGDELGRRNLVAILKGDANCRRTVVLLGHVDTVATDDYGDLQPFAHDPARLAIEMAKKKLDADTAKDLTSGEWLFGRGVFDMKSGVAAQVAVLSALSQSPLPGNVVLLAVPDEENSSVGMLAAVETLNELAEQEGFDYMAAIDSDYMAPRYPGDENKYVYIGTVGKLLPTFYITGQETHVGQSFEGLDPNQLASELTRLINLSMEFCDGAEGEYPSPPVTLRQKDLKTQYSVQTAPAALLYFNYATHQSTPDIVLEKLKAKAKEAFANVITNLNRQYELFCAANGISYQRLPWEPRVTTFAEFYAEVRDAVGEDLDRQIAALKEDLCRDKSLDGRDFTVRVVEEINKLSPRKGPMILVMFAPPYYPHIYVKGETPREMHLLASVRRAVAAVEAETGYRIVQKKFYPYISDLSYFSLGDASAAAQSLLANMPAWGKKYDLPLSEIGRLNLPVVNIGPYGKDAHKYTERLQADFAFNVVPQLLQKTIAELIKQAK